MPINTACGMDLTMCTIRMAAVPSPNWKMVTPNTLKYAERTIPVTAPIGQNLQIMFPALQKPPAPTLHGLPAFMVLACPPVRRLHAEPPAPKPEQCSVSAAMVLLLLLIHCVPKPSQVHHGRVMVQAVLQEEVV